MTAMIRVHVEGSPILNLPSGAIEVPQGRTVLELLRDLGVHPDSVLPFRQEVPLPVDSPLWDGDRILLVPVVSGGGRLTNGKGLDI